MAARALKYLEGISLVMVTVRALRASTKTVQPKFENSHTVSTTLYKPALDNDSISSTICRFLPMLISSESYQISLLFTDFIYFRYTSLRQDSQNSSPQPSHANI